MLTKIKTRTPSSISTPGRSLHTDHYTNNMNSNILILLLFASFYLASASDPSQTPSTLKTKKHRAPANYKPNALDKRSRNEKLFGVFSLLCKSAALTIAHVSIYELFVKQHRPNFPRTIKGVILGSTLTRASCILSNMHNLVNPKDLKIDAPDQHNSITNESKVTELEKRLEKICDFIRDQNH